MSRTAKLDRSSTPNVWTVVLIVVVVAACDRASDTTAVTGSTQ